MVAGWDDVAAHLESRLDAAEALLDAGAVDAPIDGFHAPGLPQDVPTGAQQARLEAITHRIDDLQERMRHELQRLGGEIAASGRERGAARTYLGSATTR